MRHFIVKDLSRLEDYGFFKSARDGWYGIKTNRTTNAYIDEETGEASIQSPSKEMVYIFCEMYKEGVLTSYDDDVDKGYRMVLTKEEKDLILKLRQEKEACND